MHSFGGSKGGLRIHLADPEGVLRNRLADQEGGRGRKLKWYVFFSLHDYFIYCFNLPNDCTLNYTLPKLLQTYTESKILNPTLMVYGDLGRFHFIFDEKSPFVLSLSFGFDESLSD